MHLITEIKTDIIKMAGKLSWFVFLAVGLVVAVLFVNTIISRQRQYPWDDGQPPVAQQWTLDRERLGLRAQKLATALTFQTVSWERGSVSSLEAEAFFKLHRHLHTSDDSPLLNIYNK